MDLYRSILDKYWYSKPKSFKTREEHNSIIKILVKQETIVLAIEEDKNKHKYGNWKILAHLKAYLVMIRRTRQTGYQVYKPEGPAESLLLHAAKKMAERNSIFLSPIFGQNELGKVQEKS